MFVIFQFPYSCCYFFFTKVLLCDIKFFLYQNNVMFQEEIDFEMFDFFEMFHPSVGLLFNY